MCARSLAPIKVAIINVERVSGALLSEADVERAQSRPISPRCKRNDLITPTVQRRHRRRPRTLPHPSATDRRTLFMERTGRRTGRSAFINALEKPRRFYELRGKQRVGIRRRFSSFYCRLNVSFLSRYYVFLRRRNHNVL